MAQSKEPTRPLVIGIIGGSSDASEETLKSASEIGAAIVQNGAILLTGGKAIEEKSVKAYAMCAARDAATEARPTGIIGILPEKSPDQPIDLAPDKTSPSCHHLYVYTDVSSHVRNILTGSIADITIALPGKAGTLSEIAYALQARKALLFLNSWESLFTAFKQRRNEIVNIIDKLHEVRYPADQMVENLSKFFSGEHSVSNYVVFNGVVLNGDLNKIVIKIAKCLGAGMSFSSALYPVLDQHPIGRFRDEFNSKLEKLSLLVQKEPDGR
jgi:uncharacterized protein (TIGR00725 family)